MIDSILQNKLREQYNPEGSLLRKQQLRMLEMLKYLDEICKSHDIKYWLSSGTLLGAVRHGGFIPWDDDVDVEMLREDFEKFEKIMQNVHSADYVLQTHRNDPNYFAPYGKLRDLHSHIKEENSNDLHYRYTGCYIDIFIIEPSCSKFLSQLGGIFWYRLLSGSNNLGRIRSIFYPLAYTMIYHILFPLLRLISALGADKQYRFALGSCLYEPRNYDDIFPLCTLLFEDTEFPVPGNSDSYLRKIYGDYLQLPDLNNLKRHIVTVEIYEK